MSVILIKKSIGFIIIFTFSFSFLSAQPSTINGKIAPRLFQMLEEYHYSPQIRNTKLSGQIFENLIQTIDPNGLFFTDKTFAALAPYRDSLCTNDPKLITDFLSLLAEKYKERLIISDSIAKQCFSSPLKFNDVDSLVVAPKNSVIRIQNNQELFRRWEKWVEYIVLRNLVFSINDSCMKQNQTIPDSLYSPTSILVKKVRMRELRRLNQLLYCSGGIENFVANSYLNSITSCYDPHSSYFSVTDKEKFDSSLSKENYAFGFELGKNQNDEVIISGILSGSPIWYSGKLAKGDVIVKIKLPGQEESDLSFASIIEVDNIFKTLNDNSVELTVRKMDGSEVTVEMIKGKFDSRENLTLGFILNGEIPVGYLWFSSFYIELNQFGNFGCSIDILKEIMKLMESGAKGLILDLRNNPGGSEGEALEIATYFTGDVPMAIESDKTRIEHVLKNKDGKKWYDDPVVVLVNNNSASASELLSAILQDYHRAVIVGSNTFGKATGQYVLPVGRRMTVPNPYAKQSNVENLGFAKLTTGKIFRIDGKSYQKTGVTPDILLPDIYENFSQKESDYYNALGNDPIKTSVVYTPQEALPLDSLSCLNKRRLTKTNQFVQMAKLNQSLKPLIAGNKKETINFGQYKNEAEQLNKLITEFYKVQELDSTRLKVENTAFREKELINDSLEAQINKKFMNSVKKDIYVDEARCVLLDLMRMTKK